jgi:FkbM family methyltransferase
MRAGGTRSRRTRVRQLLSPVARKVVGTRFESVAYGLWNAVVHRSLSPKNVEYDHMTVSVMQRILTPDSNGIDVGAHRGTILRHLIELAPGGHHVAVEPLPAFARGLRRQFPNVEVLELALSDVAGESTFHHVVTSPSYSGLSTRRYPHHGEVVEDIAVRVERLDDVVRPDRPIQFLKIDVEGSELGVLTGARRLLERWRPVVVFEHGWDGGKRPADDDTTGALWDVLTSTGLAVYELSAWLDDGAPLTQAGFEDSLAKGTYYFLAAAPHTGP